MLERQTGKPMVIGSNLHLAMRGILKRKMYLPAICIWIYSYQ